MYPNFMETFSTVVISQFRFLAVFEHFFYGDTMVKCSPKTLCLSAVSLQASQGNEFIGNKGSLLDNNMLWSIL